jgi:hypothetical protein
MHKPDQPNDSAAPVPTEVTDRLNLSTEHQREGDARRPSDTLDKTQSPQQEHEPRKTSLLWNE